MLSLCPLQGNGFYKLVICAKMLGDVSSMLLIYK